MGTPGRDWDDDGTEVEVETIKSGDKDNSTVH